MKRYLAGVLVGFIGGALWTLTLDQTTAWAADRYRNMAKSPDSRPSEPRGPRVGPRSGW